MDVDLKRSSPSWHILIWPFHDPWLRDPASQASDQHVQIVPALSNNDRLLSALYNLLSLSNGVDARTRIYLDRQLILDKSIAYADVNHVSLTRGTRDSDVHESFRDLIILVMQPRDRVQYTTGHLSFRGLCSKHWQDSCDIVYDTRHVRTSHRELWWFTRFRNKSKISMIYVSSDTLSQEKKIIMNLRWQSEVEYRASTVNLASQNVEVGSGEGSFFLIWCPIWIIYSLHFNWLDYDVIVSEHKVRTDEFWLGWRLRLDYFLNNLIHDSVNFFPWQCR